MRFYMVEYQIPSPLPSGILGIIPQQQAKINDLLSKGDVISYSVANDRTKVWMVVKAEQEIDVSLLLISVPLSDFVAPSVSELMFYMGATLLTPNFSLN